MQILRGYAMRNTLQIYSDVKLSQTKDKKINFKNQGVFLWMENGYITYPFLVINSLINLKVNSFCFTIACVEIYN